VRGARWSRRPFRSRFPAGHGGRLWHDETGALTLLCQSFGSFCLVNFSITIDWWLHSSCPSSLCGWTAARDSSEVHWVVVVQVDHVDKEPAE
jgi:hypothetical protein